MLVGRSRFCLALWLTLISSLAPSASAADKRSIAETDLFRFVWVADPQISPDGKQVAFVRVSVNAKKEGYDTAIWIAPTDGSEPPRAFTSGPGQRPALVARRLASSPSCARS